MTEVSWLETYVWLPFASAKTRQAFQKSAQIKKGWQQKEKRKGRSSISFMAELNVFNRKIVLVFASEYGHYFTEDAKNDEWLEIGSIIQSMVSRM